jgi:hypothetical protein
LLVKAKENLFFELHVLRGFTSFMFFASSFHELQERARDSMNPCPRS